MKIDINKRIQHFDSLAYKSKLAAKDMGTGKTSLHRLRRGESSRICRRA